MEINSWNFTKKTQKSAVLAVYVLGFVALISVGVLGIIFWDAIAATGTPSVITYEGRLTDASGNLLGGSGTRYYFKFSIWDNETVASGSRLWPSSAPGTASTTVRQGVFTVDIGDPAETPDLLTYNFNDNDTVYLQVEVSSASGGPFETLGPRQRITSAGFAINAETVDGADAGTAAGDVLLLGSSGQIDIIGDIITTQQLQGGQGLTSGTAIDIDTLTGYVGSLIDLKVASTTQFSVDEGGVGYFAGRLSVGTSTTAGAVLAVYDGDVTFQTPINSSTAFRVLNAATSSVFVVDTSNRRVGISTTTPGKALSVQGDIVADDIITASIFRATSTTATSTFGATTGDARTGLEAAGLHTTNGLTFR